MTFKEFELAWQTYQNKHSELRRGQALMITLAKYNMKEYNRICGGQYKNKKELDCFYVDEFIPNTLHHLKEVWEE